MTWSSAPEATKALSSVGCHSTDVIGALCQLNVATGEGFAASLQNRKVSVGFLTSKSPTYGFHERISQTLRFPSSPPLTSKYAVVGLRFQLITFTSASWARSTATTLLRPFTRTSHIRIDWSAEHDANTVGSDGDH